MKKPKKWQVWKYRAYIDFLAEKVKRLQDISMRYLVDDMDLIGELNKESQRLFSRNVDLEKENKRLCDEVRSLRCINTDLQRKVNET